MNEPPVDEPAESPSVSPSSMDSETVEASREFDYERVETQQFPERFVLEEESAEDEPSVSKTDASISSKRHRNLDVTQRFSSGDRPNGAEPDVETSSSSASEKSDVAAASTDKVSTDKVSTDKVSTELDAAQSHERESEAAASTSIETESAPWRSDEAEAAEPESSAKPESPSEPESGASVTVDEEPPAAESDAAAPTKSRGTSDAMLKNRFHEPTRQTLAAASLEEEVQQSLDDDRLAPQYRRLATNVKEQYPGDVSAVLLLTSPAANLRLGETLMHLAALMDEETADDSDDARMLVVDAGLADKLLTDRMQATGRPGLAEILGRRKDWHDYVVPTTRPRVDFLPAGEGPVTSYKSIGGKLAPLLDEWKDRYRYVLVDAGAAGEPLTDPLAQVCDATYLHVSLSETDASAAQQAAETLRSAGARLRGCVVEQ